MATTPIIPDDVANKILKKFCAEYWLKELQESMDRCTGRLDMPEILLKTALNSIQSINQSILKYLPNYIID